MKEHLKRIIENSKNLLPEVGTKEYEEVKKKIQLHELAYSEVKKLSKLKFKEALNTAKIQDANHIGLGVDLELRHYLREFNSRSWNHGHRSMPIMFNVIEAFFDLEKRINSWILLEEENYKISFFDFIDYYTSKDFEFNLEYHLENFEEDLIHHYHVEENLKKITFKTLDNKEFVIAGISIVRRGKEVSMLFLTGEMTDTDEITSQLSPINFTTDNPNKMNLRPHNDFPIEAVKLNDDPELWKVLIACRFDLESETIDIRYVAKDVGNAYNITTDDVTGFLYGEKKIEDSDNEKMFRQNLKEIREYDSIFELAKAVLYLPMYFNDNEERITDEEFKTELSTLIKNPMAKRKYENVPNKYKIRTRHVWSLEREEIDYPDIVKLRDENFKIETSGHYRSLEPGQIGTDKMDRPIKGRTWVNRTEAFFEASYSELIISKRKENRFNGKNSGRIYIMRNSSLDKNVFKIGLTTNSTDERAKQLSKTSIPDKFHVMNEWEVKNCAMAEKRIHEILHEFRVDPRREFFKVKMSLANKVIEDVVSKINKA